MILPVLAACALAAAGAKAPARPYDVQHYRVDLRLQNDGAFENQAAITLVPARSLPKVELDSYGLDVQSVTLNGASVKFTLNEVPAQRSGVLTLTPPKPLAAKKPATFVVQYKGKASIAQEGLFRVDHPSNPKLPPYFFTQFQAEYARRFVPSNDRPSDKATTELFAVVDAKYTVLSNGTRLKDETFTENGENLRRVHWKQETPHPLYAMALAVGQFEPVEVNAGVKSTIWVTPGTADGAFFATDATSHALSFQQAFLGTKYPWVKYDQVSVPTFHWGGMENTSLVLMRENGLVLEDRTHIFGRTRISGLIAHELAHQWFGDLVTCTEWSDLWLNEGFATFLTWKTEDAYYDNDYTEVDRAKRVFVDYFREEDGPRSHPLVVRGGDARDSFDSISYAKGAHVLRMLEHWVGEENFKKGLKAYLEKYAHKTARSEEFFATFAQATGTQKTLKAFQNAWLNQRGYPIITPEANWNGSQLVVTVKQKPNHADVKGPFVFKLPVVFHRDGAPSYKKEEVIVVDKPQVTVKFDLPAAPTWINWNQDGVALVRVHAPAVSEQQWAAAVRSDPDPVWRTLAAFVLMGELINPDAAELKTPSVTAMDALTHLLQNDASPYVREAVLERLAHAKWKRLPETLAPVVLELARRPRNLPEDAMGMVRVRRAALSALGKFDSAKGRTYLFEQVMSPNLDLSYLPGAAIGTANLGDPEALATLRAAIRTAKARGYPWYKGTAVALGSVTSPEVVPVLNTFVQENAGNNELMTELHLRLRQNHILTGSPQFARFLQTLVLENDSFGDGLKGRMLRLLDEVKSNHAKEALLAVAQKSQSAALQASAQRVLDKNFPGAGAPAIPAKGKAKKGAKAR